MSFNVNWNTLETDSLRNWTTELLTGALNSGKRPTILASDITIKDLNFGKIAPDFEILEIGELDKDRFRGIFKINYDGDFHLTLHTQVQANPLKIYSDNSRDQELVDDSSFVTPEFLLSTEPFNIPLDLKLSDIKISGIGIIVFSQTKGLTLVFRNDPLDSIKVSSTFDTVQVLSNFLQTQIENQIRDLFRETLPTLIHQYSLKYTSSFKKNDFMNNLKDHLKDQIPSALSDPLELENVASSNLKKLAKLYSSRETLELNIPKFKKTLQRNHLEKFNRDYYPTLANSLYSNLNLPPTLGVSQQDNSLPVELIVNTDFKQVDNILKEISSIQTKSFRSGNTDVKRAKRRIIKIGKGSKKCSKDSTSDRALNTEDCPLSSELVNKTKESPMESLGTFGDVNSSDLSDTSTVHEDQGNSIHQPTPVKHSQKRPLIHPSLGHKDDIFTHTSKHASASPLNTSSSFVGGVGLGSSFLNIASGTAICGSPLRNDSTRKTTHDAKVRVKKSMNRVDIEHINEKLNTAFSFDDTKLRTKHDEAFSRKLVDSCFENPPPPYYQAPRVKY
ncbi:hypothetical protein METBIDRAFT_30739 [Metschnikowia bicuspidata var. bicuspidata NRRL YB-4993]|uniref:Mitochondrial distribution and morphology protein 34 n=1 Tax=Metschnikowia bicuspidata var. bicuspidata NRRL YB-4993 TaxID=869754 RepID=A0A1A0HKG2_9ASCO|nr:hypothetical protein METBIDRAFT_30739 [Metschnikowia bicuspidata var. bicuspidata NRRL YB-4993]OBA24476.1 hypothetical protein METBIDRAFT_30739 [Metschnikowia bicuspidata var. bicuspidata NRRL YB-4993]